MDHLITSRSCQSRTDYTDERAALFYEQLADRLAAIPGVKLVSPVRVPAIAGSYSTTNITVEDFRASKRGRL